MPTLHWFHTLGTAARTANYSLTPQLAERLEPWFPNPLAQATPDLSDALGQARPIVATAVATASSGTAGLLWLLGNLRKGWTLKLHRVDTPATRLNPRQVSGSPLDTLAKELPDWVPQPTMSQEDDCTLLEDRSPASIAKLVRWMLGRQIEDGDAVFFEATSGLRPIQMALTLGADLLRVVRPGLAVAGTAYAELGAPGMGRLPKSLMQLRPKVALAQDTRNTTHPDDGGAPNVPLSPFYDVSEVLALPSWGSAGADLERRLDGSRLSELLRAPETNDRAVSRPLNDLTRALDLAWPEDMIEPLHAIQQAIQVREGDPGNPARAALFKVLGDRLEPLVNSCPKSTDGPIDMPRVEFHLRVAEGLTSARRYGDALRVLRETLVSRMVLAQGEVRGWQQKGPRRRAETALFRSPNAQLSKLWRDVGDLRNKTSHANLADTANRKSLKEVAIALGARADDGTGSESGTEETCNANLIERVRELVKDPSAWIPAAQQGEVVVWLKPTPQAGPCDPVRARWAAAFKRIEDGKAKLSDALDAVSAKNARNTQPGRVVDEPTHSSTPKLPGKGWADKKVKPNTTSFPPSIRHVVFCGNGPPSAHSSRAALSRALLERSVLPWCWVPDPSEQSPQGPGQMFPLFDKKQLVWTRPELL